MAKQLFLHLGLHKTGSTLLQLKALKLDIPENVRVISVHHDADFEYRKWRTSFVDLRNSVLFNLRKGNRSTIAELAEMIDDLLKQTDDQKIIWSDENLLGVPPGLRIGRIFLPSLKPYPNSFLIAKAFGKLKNRYEISSRVYLREHHGQ